MSEISMEILAAELKAIREENEKLKEANGQILSQLSKVDSVSVKENEPLKIPENPVEVSKKKYKFQVAKFHFDGNVYISEELQIDSESKKAQEILAAIIKIEGQGILKEVK